MRYLIILAILNLSFANNVSANTDSDDYYFKVNKSFELFGAVYRELNRYYVEKIDPEMLMEDGIKGMLSNLDPYTSYLDEGDVEDIDMLTTGAYVGFGFTVGMRDSMLTIVGLAEGQSAFEKGVRIGDRIYKIGDKEVLYQSSENLRQYTRGEPGTKEYLYFIRDGRDDTLKLHLTRHKINVNSVSYSGIVRDSIAYVKLERFSRLSASEVKSALIKLKRNHKISGLILDLRDNPGGLLDAAVSVSETFVPNDKLIVSTKGRDGKETRDYYSNNIPLDTLLPIAVLINENSASASEIVAGAIQDLDRGVIVGKRSYGKGLVQGVFQLPFKSSLKITTSRYYTPSGRCIQRIQYLDKLKNRDTVYYTSKGRKVYESKGIKPDSTVYYSYPKFVRELISGNYFFSFANEYCSNMVKLPDDFKVDKQILNKFSAYLKKKNFQSRHSIDCQLRQLAKLAKEQNYDKSIIKQIDLLEKKIRMSDGDPVLKYADDIKPFIATEIFSRFAANEDIIEYSLELDKDIETAVNLLERDKYAKILSKK